MDPTVIEGASAFSLVITLIVSYLVPLAKDLVTHAAAPDALKSLVLVILSALAGVLPNVAFPGTDSIGAYVVSVVVAVLTAAASDYLGTGNPAKTATGKRGMGRPKSA